LLLRFREQTRASSNFAAVGHADFQEKFKKFEQQIAEGG
jgi:hypothetical protein